MKSDVVLLDSNGGGIDSAFQQVDAVASYRDLTSKETLRLHLLTEEMLGIIKGIAGDVPAHYWIEDENCPRHFVLHLSSDIIMDLEKRKQLIALTTSGRNSAAKGITGMLRDFFSKALLSDPSAGMPDYYGSGLAAWGNVDASAKEPQSDGSAFYGWSLQQYKSTVSDRKDQEAASAEAWDELEKSIVANLADEVEISIRGGKVELLVYKTM